MSLEKGHNGCNEAGLLACSFRDSTQSIFKVGPLLNYLFLSVSVTTDTEYKLTTASKQSTHSQQSPSATFLGPVVSLKNREKTPRDSDRATACVAVSLASAWCWTILCFFCNKTGLEVGSKHSETFIAI